MIYRIEEGEYIRFGINLKRSRNGFGVVVAVPLMIWIEEYTELCGLNRVIGPRVLTVMLGFRATILGSRKYMRRLFWREVGKADLVKSREHREDYGVDKKTLAALGASSRYTG